MYIHIVFSIQQNKSYVEIIANQRTHINVHSYVYFQHKMLQYIIRFKSISSSQLRENALNNYTREITLFIVHRNFFSFIQLSYNWTSSIKYLCLQVEYINFVNLVLCVGMQKKKNICCIIQVTLCLLNIAVIHIKIQIKYRLPGRVVAQLVGFSSVN